MCGKKRKRWEKRGKGRHIYLLEERREGTSKGNSRGKVPTATIGGSYLLLPYCAVWSERSGRAGQKEVAASTTVIAAAV